MSNYIRQFILWVLRTPYVLTLTVTKRLPLYCLGHCARPFEGQRKRSSELFSLAEQSLDAENRKQHVIKSQGLVLFRATTFNEKIRSEFSLTSGILEGLFWVCFMLCTVLNALDRDEQNRQDPGFHEIYILVEF